MKMLHRAALALLATLACVIGDPAFAATVPLPQCLNYQLAFVPCEGVNITDPSTGNPLLLINGGIPVAIVSGGGGGGSNAAAGAIGSTVPGYASYTGYVGADGLFHGWLGDNAGHPMVSIFGTPKFGIDQTTPGTTNNVTVGGLRYQLFGTYGGAGQTASATGTAVGPVIPGSYIFSCIGTFGGGTVTLQVLGADGATFQTVSGVGLTATGNVGIVMPNIVGATGGGSVTAPNARAVLTGATSPSVFCSLS